MDSVIFKDDELLLNYEIMGEGQPVLLIHGLACDMNLMKGCMEPVFSNVEGYKRIYIDLPGMGKSNALLEETSTDAILEVLIKFVGDIIVDDFILIGESYGGYLSSGLLLKLKQQIKKALLICPMVEPDHTKRLLPEKDVTVFDMDYLETLSSRERKSFCEYAVIGNRQTYHQYEKDVVSGLKLADNAFLGELSKKYGYSFSLEEAFTAANLQTPVLILAGKQDVCVGYEDLYAFSRYLPRSSFMLIDQAGHNLQIDQADLFSLIALNWLAI